MLTMANWFNRSLKIPQVKTSVHDLSNDYKSSINFGSLYPVYVEESVPKTKFLGLSHEIFLRFAPMKFPIMHRCKVRSNDFGVPFRLIMGDDNYQKWTNNELDIIPLRITNGTASTFSTMNTILDYLGYQTHDIAASTYIDIPNPLAYFSYLLIWRTWYADEVLDATEVAYIDDMLEEYRTAMAAQDSYYGFTFTESTVQYIDILPISYSKDYFTAAQTEPQRGDNVFMMNPLQLASVGGDILPYADSAGAAVRVVSDNTSEGYLAAGNSSGYFPLRSTDTIRDLWQKEQLQRYEDISALFGTRTNEYLAGHFGVVSSDARLQMPQFINGGEQIVQISEVVQTSSDTDDSPLGAMAGKGTAFGRTKSAKYFCEEHMFVITLLSVVPDNGYMTGNPRYFYKQNIFDFASPEFNNIGYQAIYNGEIYADNSDTDLEEFGYQPRYSEYRQHRSIATGDFRDSTLMAWHLNRSFDELPSLNADFVHVDNEDAVRIFNDTDADDQHIYIDVFNKVTVSSVVSYMPSSLHL